MDKQRVLNFPRHSVPWVQRIRNEIFDLTFKLNSFGQRIKETANQIQGK